MKAVIIDDSADHRAALKAIILAKQPECEVFEAKDGIQGLILVGQKRPDIVFLDLFMPEINGYTALQILRAFNSSIYIAVVSTQRLRSIVEAALKLKANTFLLKPFDPEHVADRLKRAQLPRSGQSIETRPPFETTEDDF